MSLSPQSIEILLDLLEIKMGYMHIQDRDDAKELLKLRYCRQELLTMLETFKKQTTSKKQDVVKFPRQAVKMVRKQTSSGGSTPL